MSGKGPQPRPIDRKAWDESPLWKNRDKKLKDQKDKKDGEIQPK